MIFQFMRAETCNRNDFRVKQLVVMKSPGGTTSKPVPVLIEEGRRHVPSKAHSNQSGKPTYLTVQAGCGSSLASYSRCMDPPRSGFELELLLFERIILTLDDQAR
jgi:hypothetical protein